MGIESEVLALEVDPKVVGVENPELADRLEVLDVF